MGFRRKKRGANAGIQSRSLLRGKRVVAKQRKVEIVDDGREGIFSRPTPQLTQITAPEGSLCIIRSLGGIGDVLMITPGIRALKKKYPKLTITVAIDRHRTWDDSYYHLLENAPFIDHLIDARYVSRNKYDKVVDISSVCMPYEKKGLPNRSRIDLFARHLGVNYLENQLPFLQIKFDEYEWARSIIVKNRESINSPIICFAPSSNDEMRSWKKERAREFVKSITKRYPSILLIAFDMHNFLEGMDGFLNMSNTTVRQMAALIQQCHTYVGPDSGPMHIAGALGKESVVLFGAIPPAARIGGYSRHLPIVTDELSCIGCWYGPCPYNIACMDKISASLVVSKTVAKLSPKSKLNIKYDSDNKYFTDLLSMARASKLLSLKDKRSEIILNSLEPGKENLGDASFFDARAKYIYAAYPFTKPPQNWIASINTYDKLIVPSKAYVDSFKNAGVVVPIEYCPIGVDLNEWSHTDRKDNKVTTFAMISNGKWFGPNENLEIGLAAFKKAFGDSEDVRLIVMGARGEVPNYVFSSTNISVFHKKHTTLVSIKEVLKNTDYLIHPSKGSSYAQLPMQAMAMGVPVIGCSFGSTRELMSLLCNYPVAYELDSDNKDGNMYASLDIDSLSYTLKAASSEKHLLKEKRIQAREHVEKHHSLETSVARLLKTIGAE